MVLWLIWLNGILCWSFWGKLLQSQLICENQHGAPPTSNLSFPSLVSIYYLCLIQTSFGVNHHSRRFSYHLGFRYVNSPPFVAQFYMYSTHVCLVVNCRRYEVSSLFNPFLLIRNFLMRVHLVIGLLPSIQTCIIGRLLSIKVRTLLTFRISNAIVNRLYLIFTLIVNGFVSIVWNSQNCHFARRKDNLKGTIELPLESRAVK